MAFLRTVTLVQVFHARRAVTTIRPPLMTYATPSAMIEVLLQMPAALAVEVRLLDEGLPLHAPI